MLDLGVGELLGRTEQAVAGVADDNVDAAELLEHAVDDFVDGGRVSYVEHFYVERLRAERSWCSFCRGVVREATGRAASVSGSWPEFGG